MPPDLEYAPELHCALRILVADDNRDSADSCQMLLAASGHDVRVAYSGEQAFDIAASFQPEFALLDIGMPGMNGYQLARRIRASAWAARTMLVAVTGWGHEDDRRRALDAGFDRHLTKPIDINTLSALLEERANQREGG
jgi:DNA-binding response OmpR family regulator